MRAPGSLHAESLGMNDFLTTLKTTALLADGAMGSYLFERTGRLSELNHVYETFNADQPDLIREVHLAYLTAGARCLKTNTFGANREALRLFGLEHRVAELNRAGVAVARQAIDKFQPSGPIFILASVGPTRQPVTTQAAVEECYREQLENLIAARPDALLFETFNSITLLESIIELARSLPNVPPIIAEMTISSTQTGLALEPDPSTFITRMYKRGVAVAGVNCCAPWDASAFVDAVRDNAPVRSGKLLLSVMPNAGGFQRIGNRFMSRVNPEYMGTMARSFLDRGVRLIGGCCEMHPPFIREMQNFLHSRQPGAAATVSVAAATALPPVGPAEKCGNGPFSRKLFAGEFVVSVEQVPPRGTDLKLLAGKIAYIADLAGSGLVDAVDITDGSRGIPLMPPGDFVNLIREQLRWDATTGDKVELIPHFTTRDLNVMGLQSRLIGYHFQRIHNVLYITGDPPKMSPTYPRSTAVFDFDSVALIRATQNGLNSGVDFGGAPLGKQSDPRTHFTIGTGFESEALNLDVELAKLERKIDAGADYVMTQPAFRCEQLAVVEKYRSKIPFLIGVMILANFEHAKRMTQVPGVVVPDNVLQRLSAYESIADQAKAGMEIAIEQIQWVRREGWPGLYLMALGLRAETLHVLRAGK
jgi:methionine synthase / methylenetetrahydrofolate reductase(NADPH)